MEFDLTTFILEIVNFLILIWILQRLFYKPMREIIARRKRQIDQSLEEAEQMHKQALDLKHNYENRQQQWEREKQSALADLHQQLEAEKQRQMLQLQQALEQERHKAQTAMQRQQQETLLHQQKLALQNGARFAALLLQQAAGPELEARLFDLLTDQLNHLPEPCLNSLQTQDSKQVLEINISSAYHLDSEQTSWLEQKLKSLLNNPLQFNYHQNPELIAGLQIDIGAWILHANLQHELNGFAEIADDF